MKAKIISLLLVLSWVAAGALVYMHKDRVQLVKLPPASLAQWYKPQNKRQLWLHNMFNLRREMQAVAYYAAAEQEAPLSEWSERLNEHYLKISEMVPEWEWRLDLEALSKLLVAQDQGRYTQIAPLLEELQKNCDSCHQQFRAVTAALYRAPDFHGLELEEGQPLSESMRGLGEEVNKVKIAIAAGDSDWAQNSYDQLNKGINQLAGLCENCHQQSLIIYPSPEVKIAQLKLQAMLLLGDSQKQGEALGELAVSACANCHATHRISYDLKTQLSAHPGLLELLAH